MPLDKLLLNSSSGSVCSSYQILDQNQYSLLFVQSGCCVLQGPDGFFYFLHLDWRVHRNMNIIALSLLQQLLSTGGAEINDGASIVLSNVVAILFASFSPERLAVALKPNFTQDGLDTLWSLSCRHLIDWILQIRAYTWGWHVSFLRPLSGKRVTFLCLLALNAIYARVSLLAQDSVCTHCSTVD